MEHPRTGGTGDRAHTGRRETQERQGPGGGTGGEWGEAGDKACEGERGLRRTVLHGGGWGHTERTGGGGRQGKRGGGTPGGRGPGKNREEEGVTERRRNAARAPSAGTKERGQRGVPGVTPKREGEAR